MRVLKKEVGDPNFEFIYEYFYLFFDIIVTSTRASWHNRKLINDMIDGQRRNSSIRPHKNEKIFFENLPSFFLDALHVFTWCEERDL